MGGGRKRRKQVPSGGAWQPPVEAVSRIVALHPSGTYAVVAVGDKLRGYDTRTQETFNINNDSKAITRVAAFSPCGRWLLVGGDDKCFKLWKVDSWDACMNTFKTHKKVSAGAFTPDGNHCIAADKFGDVYYGKIDSETPTPPLSLLLGHYCSIVTSVSIPRDGKTVATTDRDNKVRVSVWPDDPSKGAFEIQSYCMGHSSFVTSSCFVHWVENSTVLVTAGGDGKVLLWNHVEGKLLGSFQVPPLPKFEEPSEEDGAPENSTGKADEVEGASSENCGGEATEEGAEAEVEGDSEPDESEKEDEGEMGGPSHSSSPEQSTSLGNVVVCFAAATNRPYLAVAAEGRDEVLILECDVSDWTVSLKQSLAFSEVSRPCFVNFDEDGRLWVAGGPVVTESDEIHLGMAEMDSSGNFISTIKQRIPPAALAFLECRSKRSSEDATPPKPASSLSQTLGKKGYKEVDFRKRYRADYRDREIMKQRSETKPNGSKDNS
ncbi:hypothetical protein BSKO_11299 [Bryopsis sp. KO-2023]|nr:hypothetical protein BSKO_11299 [Bryopsis sp. KO-2023]